MNDFELDRAIDRAQTWEDAVSCGITILQTQSGTYWALGRLANEVLGRIRPSGPNLEEQAATLKALARELRTSYSRLKETARVFRAVEPGLRDDSLHFSHYRVLVRRGVSGSDLARWIEVACDRNLTSEALDAKIRRHGVELTDAVLAELAADFERRARGPAEEPDELAEADDAPEDPAARGAAAPLKGAGALGPDDVPAGDGRVEPRETGRGLRTWIERAAARCRAITDEEATEACSFDPADLERELHAIADGLALVGKAMNRLKRMDRGLRS